MSLLNTFDFESKSINELDAIALNNCSILGRLAGHGPEVRANVDDLQVGDWKCKWIAKGTTVFSGVLILTPTNARTKRLVIIGRCNHLSKQYDIAFDEAHEIVRASWGLQYTNEYSVLRLVLAAKNDPMWNFTKIKASNDVVSEFIAEMRHRYPDIVKMSRPKLRTAITIVNRLREGNVGMPIIKGITRDPERMFH